MSIGKLRDGVYDFNTKCSICGKPRNAGGHRKCSKILQQRNTDEQNRRNAQVKKEKDDREREELSRIMEQLLRMYT